MTDLLTPRELQALQRVAMGGADVVQVATELQVSPPRARTVLRGLQQRGLVRSTPVLTGGAGRPRKRWALSGGEARTLLYLYGQVGELHRQVGRLREVRT